MGEANLALEVDGVRLEVDARAGGRVTSLRRGDVEVLSGPDVDADNYGSTFWTSPQSDWGWPPPAEIDRGPYAVDATGDAVTLTGSSHDALGIRVTKRFSIDRVRRAFAMEYAMHNLSGAPKTYAPWEVTRVPPGGLTFFPVGMPATGTLRLDERAGASWFAHDGVSAPSASLPAAGLKAFAKGKRGWLAHGKGGLLFIKRFEEVPPGTQATGEAEIEVYANPRYVELEVQGRYATIAPGASTSWTVSWLVRELPEGVAAAAGSATLVALVDGMVRGP
jgi:Domain of unknown function (DUF4380)